MRKYSIAVVGATGAVGEEIFRVLEACSTRRYPFVGFMQERELGKDVLTVKDVSVTVDGEKLLDNVYFSVGRTDKIAFVGENEKAQTALFQILMGEMEPDAATMRSSQN